MSVKFNGDSLNPIQLQSGTVTITAGVGTVASPYHTDLPVTFEYPFYTIPTVVVSLATSETTAGYQFAAINSTYTGFTLRFTNTTGSSAGANVNWIALYKKPRS